MNDSLRFAWLSPTVAIICSRLTLAASFLSAVADRFGLWGQAGTGEVAWGSFPEFVAYTATLLWFLPHPMAVVGAWIATLLEILLAIALICGVWTRFFAAASSLLLLLFALSMTFATGPEGPLSYSVWTASAAALLLATHPSLGASAAASSGAS